MSSAKAKTINLLLEDGTLNGLISMEDSSWNGGELYSAPRESVNKLISSDACKKFGVYLLISKDKVYVGQSSDLSKRIRQHLIGKDWWERVIVLTTISDTLNRSDIDFLESVLINKATISNKLDCDNKNKGNKPKVDKYKQIALEQWLDEALLLMELIGITVFCPDKKDKSTTNIFDTINKTSKSKVEIRAKKYAKEYLVEKGYDISKTFSYARKQDNKDIFWLNPQISLIESEWTIVLNNQEESIIYLLIVPANTFSILNKGEKVGLRIRRDKPNQIDLEINSNSLIDERSKCDFSPYVKAKIEY